MLAGWYRDAYLAGDAVRFSPFDHKIQSRVQPDRGCLAQCHLGQRQVSIAPNGRIYPCVQFVGDGTGAEWCIGDVENGLDEISRSRLRDMSTRNDPECVDCAIRGRCMHTCGCQNLQTSGRLDRVSPIVCAHEQMVLPIADRVAERLFNESCPAFLAAHYGLGVSIQDPASSIQAGT